MISLHTLIITNCPNLFKIDRFAFRGLKSLKNLIITNNKQLWRIEPHAFGTLKNLDYLSLNMNNLSEINGHIFSSSHFFKNIEFLGNPIRIIRSHAFHNLRNVTNLIISKDENETKIEEIEADSFISTAFVENIYLQKIATKNLHTHSFRGLSNCNLLDLSNSYIESIENNVFFGARNIENINLSNCRIKNINNDSFKEMHRIKNINLEGNYLININENAYLHLMLNFLNNSATNITIINEIFIYLLSFFAGSG